MRRGSSSGAVSFEPQLEQTTSTASGARCGESFARNSRAASTSSSAIWTRTPPMALEYNQSIWMKCSSCTYAGIPAASSRVRKRCASSGLLNVAIVFKHGAPNEHKMSDGGRDRASLGVKVWKSSQKWSLVRSLWVYWRPWHNDLSAAP